MKQLGTPTKTERGFSLVEFEDIYGLGCSLQASSVARSGQPGTSAVWLGIDAVDAKVMARDAAAVGVKTAETVGWVPFPIPDEVSISTRMHLDRDQVKALVKHLQSWLDSDNGEF